MTYWQHSKKLRQQSCAARVRIRSWKKLENSDVFGPLPPFPEDAMISCHFQNEAKLTLLQWGVFLDIKNIPAPADSGEER